MTFSITSSRKRTRIAGLSMVAAALLCSPFAYAEQGSAAEAKALVSRSGRQPPVRRECYPRVRGPRSVARYDRGRQAPSQ